MQKSDGYLNFPLIKFITEALRNQTENNKKARKTYILRAFLIDFLSAESEGFEPSIPFQVYTLSRRAPSTTRTTLRTKLF